MYKPGLTLHEHKVKIISECLKLNNFNRTKTAKDLSISLRGLRNFLQKYPADFPHWHKKALKTRQNLEDSKRFDLDKREE